MRNERPDLNGMCYVYYYAKDVLDPRLAAEAMRRLNVRNVRSWSHVTWLLRTPDTADRAAADDFHRLYDLLREAGVRRITGMSHYWFFPEEMGITDRELSAVPARDPAPGSPYSKFLDLYERSWYTLVREFPEVTDWETGNEFNHKVFLRPLPGDGRTHYTLEERADICTDLMFRAARAVRAANPKARVVMPGMAPVGEHGEGVYATAIEAEYDGMIQTLERIYENIESGRFGSTNPRDFFDALAWHPYYAVQDETGAWHWKMPDDEWVRINRAVYETAVRHGDAGVGCCLTEFGFNDWGDPAEDERLARFIREGFRRIREEMPFVDTVHAYRLCDSMGHASPEPDHYAFFALENGRLRPKKRAWALSQQYGGTDCLDSDESF